MHNIYRGIWCPQLYLWISVKLLLWALGPSFKILHVRELEKYLERKNIRSIKAMRQIWQYGYTRSSQFGVQIYFRTQNTDLSSLLRYYSLLQTPRQSQWISVPSKEQVVSEISSPNNPPKIEPLVQQGSDMSMQCPEVWKVTFSYPVMSSMLDGRNIFGNQIFFVIFIFVPFFCSELVCSVNLRSVNEERSV